MQHLCKVGLCSSAREADTRKCSTKNEALATAMLSNANWGLSRGYIDS